MSVNGRLTGVCGWLVSGWQADWCLCVEGWVVSVNGGLTGVCEWLESVSGGLTGGCEGQSDWCLWVVGWLVSVSGGLTGVWVHQPSFLLVPLARFPNCSLSVARYILLWRTRLTPSHWPVYRNDWSRNWDPMPTLSSLRYAASSAFSGYHPHRVTMDTEMKLLTLTWPSHPEVTLSSWGDAVWLAGC